MSQIEDGLHAHHAQLRANGSAAFVGSTEATNSLTLPGLVHEPFASVNSVVAGSPASEAGLRVGDQIILFGSANTTNQNKLSKVAAEVQDNEGVRLSSLAGSRRFSDPVHLRILSQSRSRDQGSTRL